ncbi:hypothetical protein LJC56_02785 [Christensenellaceae bacterium OttesenSCG-928-K19]|nr:hypothetical protein [Christensenellaceae bacterium OttesenSCG-928-K19]
MLGQKIISDFGANVTFEGGYSLQDLTWWAKFIGDKQENIRFDAKNAELYFESVEFDADVECLSKFEIKYVHGVKEHDWGQRVIRLYDPDGHIIEIGEDLGMVIKRFLKQGMTADQVAEKTMGPLDYIKKLEAEG